MHQICVAQKGIWYGAAMTKTAPPKGYTLGRHGFAKISAVEGLHLSKDMQNEFREFDRRKLPAEKRRAAIAAKYGKSR